jgi:hypothetical protein
VYFPITSDLVTNTLSIARERNVRPSKRRIRVSRVGGSVAPDALIETVRFALLNGHPLPLQRIFTPEPGGAFTLSRRIRAPRRFTRPAMRTTGNGLMSLNAFTGLPPPPTRIGSEATARAFVCTCSDTW